MATVPLTIRGHEKLKAELQQLKSIERHAVIQAIAEARAQGDLSENAEDEAAKDKQGFIEGRILELESKLAAAQVIDPTKLDAGGRVVFGTTVDETRTAIADSRYIRTAALANRVTYYTTMAGCEAATEALKHQADFGVLSLQELHTRLH